MQDIRDAFKTNFYPGRDGYKDAHSSQHREYQRTYRAQSSNHGKSPCVLSHTTDIADITYFHQHSGGDATASAQSARVILADPNTEVFQHLVKVYQDVPDKYIESYLWVKKCIEKGVLTYTPLVYKNPGGRRPGEEYALLPSFAAKLRRLSFSRRTQFTDDDEQHLCKWIAEKIPYKATGGRTGNKLYQQLCEMVRLTTSSPNPPRLISFEQSNDPGYSWVGRHTWQSWRERYKKNAERLDSQINRYVDEKKPAPGEKGQYGYVRQAEASPKKTRRKRRGATENNLNQGQYGEPHDMGAIGAMPMVYAVPMDEHYNHPEIHAPIQPLPMPVPPPSSSIRAPGGGPLDPVPVRRSPAEEEMEEDPDFANVRVGIEPPPLWGKRKVSEELKSDDSRKRPKSR